VKHQPALRRDLVIIAQTYQGETSYVVKNPGDLKYFRFRALEVAVMQEFNGTNTPEDIVRLLADSGFTLSLAAVEGFGRKLQQLGLMERTLAEKSVLLLERLRADRKRALKPAAKGSLLRMRWSMGDPDQWLGRMLPRIRFMFTPRFIVVSCLLFLAYLAILIGHWPEFQSVLARLYTPSQYTIGFFLTLYLTGIVIIAIHEFGHAFTCKYFGGQVNEMGAMLIYFEPAFYCNVNDAWTFPQLRQRMWVTVAGSWIQMVVASLGAIVWWLTESGTLVHEIAAAAVIIGGLTTVLANANPLIPLDGYYALSDYLEIPNLRYRAFAYLGWWTKSKLLRLKVPEPDGTEREKRIFIWYAALACLYITTIFLLVYGIVSGGLRSLFGMAGTVLALALIVYLARGAIKSAWRNVTTAVREHRQRLQSASFRARAGVFLVLLVLIGLIPWPITAKGDLQVAPEMIGEVVTIEGGLLDRVFAVEGARIDVGEPIALLRSPALEQEMAEERRLLDSLTQLANQYRALGSAGLVRALDAEAAESQARYSGLQHRSQALTLRAPVRGVIATPRLEETIGKRLAPGERFAVVVADDSLDLRITLAGVGASLVQVGQPARLISYADPAHPLRAAVSAVSPAADSLRVGAVEARVRIPAMEGRWSAGMDGEGRVTVRRSNLAGVLWWEIRSRMRRDLLL
jgi:putative peptide zinc metalloprotease protein